MQAEYDYIVIGGRVRRRATLAARLSEDTGTRVLLLEAGRDMRSADTPEHISIPNPMRAIGDDDYRWPALMARRTASQDPRLLWRGRGRWAAAPSSMARSRSAGCQTITTGGEAAGCTGWGWAGLLPYFRKLETDVNFGDAPYHGNAGPIPVYRAPIAEWGRGGPRAALRRPGARVWLVRRP